MTPIYDIVIVGAGIHGAGIAQAAAARGWSVLVLDKGAVASGTSSKSSKLIHGGLRYLETLQLKLVYESLRERRLLLRNAPDLVQLRSFYIPLYRHSSRHPLWVRLGLSLYALLGGLGRHVRFRSVPRSEWAQLDGLNTEGLRRVFCYYDAQTDDAALTHAVLASAESMGAEVHCNTAVTGAWRDQEFYHVNCTGEVQTVRCRALVNAGGPWINHIAAGVKPEVPQLPVDLVQGVHIILGFAAPQSCYYLESADDRRGVFVLPWHGNVMVGTTETRCDAPEQCEPSNEEISYLLRVFNGYFPGFNATEKNIVAITAGLRVLPRAASAVMHKRSRDTQFVVSGALPHYLAVYGGKLTCYRATAEKAVDKLAAGLPTKKRRARTDQLPLQQCIK